ncbi:MAG: cysteine desulfurase [Rhizobiaceae bacterium]|nr:cysteine desulfurase [Rhizobiaceae bacterium]
MAKNRTKRIYLDYNASVPLLDEAREAMIGVLDSFGNASSVHFEGQEFRKTIEDARRQLGELVGANANQIIFTSGATEGATHALSPILRAGGHNIGISTLYVSAVEHPCIFSGGRFLAENMRVLPVTEGGVLDLDALREAMRSHDHTNGAAMVAVMLANNENGIMNPIEEISQIVREYGAYLVVDAVQAAGKVPVLVSELGAHFVILSSHKIGGPQGVGALILGDASLSPQPLLRGGGHENFQRAGTENVAGIAGFGAACEWQVANADNMGFITDLRDKVEAGVKAIALEAGNSIAQPVIFGESERRLGNTTCFAQAGVRGETALISLDLDGISVSSGSACSSGKVNRSHVLEAMGVDNDLGACALRISLGWDSSEGDTDKFLNAWKKLVQRAA